MLKNKSKLINTDQEITKILVDFLQTRLEDTETIDWALGLTEQDIIKRAALTRVLQFKRSALREPWSLAWKLIEQSWKGFIRHDIHAVDSYQIFERLNSGEITDDFVSIIVDYLKPRIKTEASYESLRRKKPKKLRDILYVTLTSGEISPLDTFDFSKLKNLEFLNGLAADLELALNNGVSIANKFGVSASDGLWRLGGLRFVEFTKDENSVGEVDEFHNGIAPVVKFLNAIIKQIAEISPKHARPYVERFGLLTNPIHLRIWASLALNEQLVSSGKVAEFLKATDGRRFWDSNAYPEVAILRASRFKSLSSLDKSKVLSRIQKGPPTYFWPNATSRERVDNAKKYIKARELQRIVVSGNDLPQKYADWLKAEIVNHPNLEKLTSVRFEFIKHDDGSKETDKLGQIQFDNLDSLERLNTLELWLSSNATHSEEDRFNQARHWINYKQNVYKIIDDLEVIEASQRNLPNVWRFFCRSLNSLDEHQGGRILRLLNTLPDSTIGEAIQDISQLMISSIQVFCKATEVISVWKKIWPYAVNATNSLNIQTEDSDLPTTTHRVESEELETLNNPVGHLVRVFLRLCPEIRAGKKTFNDMSEIAAVREMLLSAPGQSGLIAKHFLLENLPYFLAADEEWTTVNLITPLSSSTIEALPLWRALARGTHFREILHLLGHKMAEKTLDKRLTRKTRGSFLSSLVLETLYAFLEERTPEVSNPRVEQILRQVDDETRTEGARITLRFLKELLNLESNRSSEKLFQSAVKPFLTTVWPKDYTLATRSISSSFAKIPINSGSSFSEAVDLISPFLIPFDCWSISDFGLLGNEDGIPKLFKINTIDKATLLLKLLDMCIGKSEGSIFPHDLTDALEQVRKVSSRLTQREQFKRLAALSRNP